AVVQDVPGVTRDRVSYDASWRGRAFTVVDTGGWEPFPGVEEGQVRRELAEQVTAQARVAVEAADAVLFVLDAIVGVTDADDAVATVLRRAGKPVVVAANKVDGDIAAPAGSWTPRGSGGGPTRARARISTRRCAPRGRWNGPRWPWSWWTPASRSPSKTSGSSRWSSTPGGPWSSPTTSGTWSMRTGG